MTDDGASAPVGIIEGFFGKPWSWDDRTAYAGFLAELGFQFYIYAPKDDRLLRQRWREPWPEATMEVATSTAAAYREKGVKFGIGLSPFELHLQDPAANTADLREKVRQLNDVGPEILCILFDDMRGDDPELASRQAAIADEICAVSTADHFIACPSYYSFDPVIERVYGTRPQGYLADLGRLLDPEIDIFWTGPRVCSRSYPKAHLDEVADLLRRRPFLWDNYPVNDSKLMSPFLHLGPFHDRPAELREQIAGQAVNPMNQAWLSRLPLHSLATSYELGDAYDPAAAYATACRALCGEALAEALISDFEIFQKKGLEGMDATERDAMDKRYGAFRGDPYAAEVLRWLAGDYVFDPACLT